MASCNTILNLSENEILSINAAIDMSLTFGTSIETELDNFFADTPSIVSRILPVVKRVISDGKSEVTLDDFRVETDKGVTQEVKKQPHKSFAQTVETKDSSVDNRIKSKFMRAIVGASLFNLDTNSPVNPFAKVRRFGTALNQNLFEFKFSGEQSLVRRILAFTQLQDVDLTDTRPLSVASTIQKVLNSFETIDKTKIDQTDPIYIEAYDAYHMLKDFDAYLAEYTPFIKPIKGYENTERVNKYEYVGPTTMLNIASFKDDDYKANRIETNTSDLLQIILDTFPTCSESGAPIAGTSISQKGFSQVMTAFKQWVNTAPYSELLPAGTDSASYETLGRERIRDFYAGKPETVKALFNLFCEKVKSRNTVGIDMTKIKLPILFGIKNLFDSGITNSIKEMLWNLAFKTEANLSKSVTMRNGVISNKALQDGYKYRQWYVIQDAIQAGIARFRFKSKEQFKELCDKYGIEFPSIGKVTLFKGRPYERTIELNEKQFIEQEVPKKFDKDGKPTKWGRPVAAPDEEVKALIEDIIGYPVPDNYTEILQQLGKNQSLFDMYAGAVSLILLASDTDPLHANHYIVWNKVNGIEDADNPLRSSINMGRFNNAFTELQDFLGRAAGTDITSTYRNQSGNNIAAYNLTSMIHKVPQLAAKFGETDSKHNSFLANPIFKSMGGRSYANFEPVVRVDVNINGKIKSARDLTESELAYVGIMVDFFQSLVGNGATIELQNTAFSDKNTHFSIRYNKGMIIVNTTENNVPVNYTLEQVINMIITASNDSKTKGVKLFEDTIFNARKAAYTTILNNLAEDYKKAFGNVVGSGWDTINLETASSQEKLNLIKKTISDKKESGIQEAFKGVVDFIPELHTSKNKFNEMLEHSINMYVLAPDDTLFKEHIKRQKRLFLRDLVDSGLSLNKNLNYKTLSTLIGKIGTEWEDSTSGEVFLYKGSLNGEFEMNPMLEAYFYTDVLLSTSYNEMLFGRTFFHPNKYQINTVKRKNKVTGEIDTILGSDIKVDPQYVYLHDESNVEDDFVFDPKTGEIKFEEGSPVYSEFYVLHQEASRLSASYKRTVIAGATVHSYMSKKYGVAENIKVAVTKDIPADVFNMMGETKQVDAHDGAALTSPIYSKMENMSLLDAAAGNDKKTIFGDVEARYGAPWLLKWATFAITNDRRRISKDSDYSLENIFKKSHSMTIPEVNISRYYISSKDSKKKGFQLDNEHPNSSILTRQKDLYRFDSDTGQHFLIYDLQQNGRTATWKEIEVDKQGHIIGKEAISKNRDINTIYDIDQVFGGAYCEELNSAGVLEYSNANIDLTTDIVCHNNLKDYMIAYVVQKSAVKVGARNINSVDLLKKDNDAEFQTATVSTKYGGVQMDADHDLDESDVTEQSQMISSLAQNGFYVNEVNAIYNEIGRVVTAALHIEERLLNDKDFASIHQRLGKELIKLFAQGNKATIGLAQSFLEKAAREFEAGNIAVNMPFSDPNLMGQFIANVVSTINKSGIRRRYAGMGAVQVPSRGMIQYFRLGDKTYLRDDLAEYLRNHGYTRTVSDYINNMGTYVPATDTEPARFMLGNDEVHPFINQIDSRDADMGDTVILVDPNGKIEKPIVLNNWDNMDRVRNLLSKDYQVFKWSIKPIDLRAADTHFKIGEKTYSIYDLDSTRALHYLKGLMQKDGTVNFDTLTENDLPKLAVIENALKETLPRKGRWSAQEVAKYRLALLNKQKADLKALDKNQPLDSNLAFGVTYAQPRAWLYTQKGGSESLAVYNPTLDLTRPVPLQLLEYIMQNHIGLYEINKRFTDVTLPIKIAAYYNETGDLERALWDAAMLNVDINELAPLLRHVDIIKGNVVIDLARPEEDQIFDYKSDLLLTQEILLKNIAPDIIPSNVETRFAEIITGRMNAKQLGLRKNDAISTIQEKGPKFFAERLAQDYNIPFDDVIDSSEYDAVLIGPDGEKLFVVLKDKHQIPNDYIVSRTTFENRDGVIYFKGEELCSKGTKKFYKKNSVTGQEVHIAVVNSLDDVDEILDSSAFYDIRYNYSADNYIVLAQHQFKDYLDEEGNIIKDIYLNKKTSDPNNGNTLLRIDKGQPMRLSEYLEMRGFEINRILEYLAANEEFETDRKINRLAESRYKAFEMQLQMVGARIPTQSMQSFSGFQTVGYSNSDLNEVYIPATISWLEGSDYDIDKLYLLGYELDKKGRLQTFSKLQDIAPSFNSFMTIEAPNGVKYTESQVSSIIVSKEEMEQVFNGDYSVFNRILKSDETSIRFERGKKLSKKEQYAEDAAVREFLKILNKHSTTRLSPRQQESALKNSVAYRTLDLVKKVRNQTALHTPIALDMLQGLAQNSTLGGKEKVMHMDCPTVKFTMQRQNMEGKSVIGVSAVGMKVFFACTSFVNQKILELRDAIKIRDTKKIQTILNDICFEDPLHEGQICTIANVNFEPVIEELSQHADYIIDKDGSIPLPAVDPFTGLTINLKSVIQQLVKKSQEVDAAQSISELVTAATDNAKELILSKINATIDWADAWTNLVMTGHSFKEIGDLMMSDIFNLVTKYSKTNVFADLLNAASVKKAMSFVLGTGQLSSNMSRAMKIVMAAWKSRGLMADPHCFIDKLKYKTYEKDGDGHVRGELVLENGKPVLREIPLIDSNPKDAGDPNSSDYAQAFEKGSNFRKNIFDLIGRLENDRGQVDSEVLRLDIQRLQVLIDHVYSELIEAKKRARRYWDEEAVESEDDYEEENYNESEEEAYDDPEDEEDIERRLNEEDFGAESDLKLSLKELRDLYRYLTQYVLPKNLALQKILGIEKESDWNNHSAEAIKKREKGIKDIEALKDYYQKMSPATEEQGIIGSILSVNQGLKTSQAEFYGKLKKVENFINDSVKKSLTLSEKDKAEDFNIIRFLKEDDYKEKWIALYDKIKIELNPLKIIDSVANFKAMFGLNKMAFDFMGHSFAADLNFRLADAVLNDSTKRLSVKEWDVLNKYSKELLIMNWFFMNNFKVTVPTFSAITGKELDGDKMPIVYNAGREEAGRTEFYLNSVDGLASFVYLMENWVFPYLKNKYKGTSGDAFVKNIVLGNRFSKSRKENVHHAKLSLDMMTIDESLSARNQYSAMLKAFNAIADEELPIGMNIKDAIFLYNMLVYKNSFSQNGFTRLLETVSASGENSKVADWSKFISDLDAGKYTSGVETSHPNLAIDEKGNFTFGAIRGNIRDLIYRFSYTENATFKFGCKQEFDDNNAIVRVIYTDMFGNPVADPAGNNTIIEVGVPNANDYTMEMPVFGHADYLPKDEALKPKYANRYTSDSREVVDAMTQALADQFGLTVGDNGNIRYISLRDIQEAWETKDEGTSQIRLKNKEEYQRVLSSKAFIQNGVVYLVRERMSPDTALHEILHLVFAGMKFNPDPKIRERYYQLLAEADRNAKSNPENYKKLRIRYASEVASDLKEEILVHQLTDRFTTAYRQAFGTGYQFVTDLSKFAVKVLNQIMGTNIPSNVSISRLGNTSLADIEQMFHGTLMNREHNPLTEVVVQSQKIKTLKRLLIKAGEGEGRKNYIKYDC